MSDTKEETLVRQWCEQEGLHFRCITNGGESFWYSMTESGDHLGPCDVKKVLDTLQE